MIKVGIAGCGYWGPNLIRNFVSQSDAQVVMVCDPKPERLKFIQQQYPSIQTSPRFEDLLSSGIDAIILATPIQTHTPLATQALKAGKHVLIEKPFATSVKDAKALMALARRQRKILMVDHVFIYTPAVAKIKEICQRKELGEIIYFDAVRTNLGLFQRDANVIWDLASHDVSIMLHCLGRMPKAVSATGLSYFKDGNESIAYATMEFDANMIAHVHFSWLSPVKVRTILIGGTKKMILYDDTHPSEKIKVYDKGVGVNSKEGLRDLYISYRSGDMVAPRLENTEGLRLVCRDFLDSITHRRQPLSNGEFSLKVVRILEAMGKSIRANGRKVRIAA